MHTIYGIRHHGVGSAKSLLLALQQQQPDAILIEGTPDANVLLPMANHTDMKPPVAILVYNPDQLQQVAFYPFAIFSPEWVAIQFGLQHNIPVSFIDLPQEIQFGLDNQNVPIDTDPQTNPNTETTKSISEEIHIKHDPLLYIAQVAGYEDSERWWEMMIEERVASGNIFEAITELMTNLRAELQLPEDMRSLLREAFMRQRIREAKKTHQNTATICGAWHLAALQTEQYKAKDDAELLKGLKKTKTQCLWIPWTYQRLSMQSGYGAGIKSPQWYEMLWNEHNNAGIQWLVKTAHLLRNQNIDVSSAHIIEATRTATALATLRHLPIAGLTELYESAISVFCNGHTEPMSLIEQHLVVGTTMGSVPDDSNQTPLQRNIDGLIKRLKLKLTPEKELTDLDLRKDIDLQRSHFLHRLGLLNINCGEKTQQYGKKGTFHEYWKIHWQPEFAILVIEASIWGSTLDQAATNFVLDVAHNATQLDALTPLIEQVLLADLKNAVVGVMEQLHNLAATTHDLNQLMNTLPPLTNVLLYGNVRQTETAMVAKMVDNLIPRIVASLPLACQSLNEEAATKLFDLLLKVHQSIGALNNQQHTTNWQTALVKLSDIATVSPLISGAVLRLLFEAGVYNIETLEQRMSFALSSTYNALQAATWLDGFLHGSALLLLNNHQLWQVLNNWVAQLTDQHFDELLPLLRRTFAKYQPTERQQIGDLANQKQHFNPQHISQNLHPERANKVLATLQMLFGD